MPACWTHAAAEVRKNLSGSERVLVSGVSVGRELPPSHRPSSRFIVGRLRLGIATCCHMRGLQGDVIHPTAEEHMDCSEDRENASEHKPTVHNTASRRRRNYAPKRKLLILIATEFWQQTGARRLTSGRIDS